MRRKLFTFLVAFLATLSGAVWGQTTINLSTSSVSGSGASIEEDSPFGPTIEIKASGKYNITGETNKYQVWIEQNVGEVEITLSDVTINLGDERDTYRPIHIQSGNTVTLIIKGTNTVSTGNKEAGITVRMGSSLKIQGTGILRAEGWLGIGDADNTCGNIEIFSGTVVARGKTYCIGCSGPVFPMEQKPTLDMTGDALLVVYDDSDNRDRGIYNIKYWGSEFEDPNDPRNHPNKGIYCNAKAQAGADHLVGSLYDNVKLDSPFPNDKFVVDLNGNTLTLGEGSYARKDQIKDTKASGTLVAYRVNHNTNKADLEGTGLPVLSDNVKDIVMYYGPNTEYRTLDLSAESDFLNAWYSFGWVDTEGNFVSKSSTNTISDSYVNHTSDANATWVVKRWSTINVNDGGTLDAPIKLVYPENANVLIQSGSGNLAEYGAKLDRTKVVANESGATAPAGSIATITLKASGNNLQDRIIELPFKIGEKSLTSAIIKLKENIVYNGAAINPVSQVLVDDEAIPSDLYSLKYYDAEQGGNELQEVPIDAGTYWVAAVAKGTSYTGVTQRQEYTIAQATLKVTKVSDVKWTIGDGIPSYSSAEFSLETIYSVSDVKDNVSINTASLTANVSESYKTTPGIYNVSYSDLVLDGTRSSNYKLNSATASGKLIVKKEGTEDDPITPGENKDPEIIPGTDEDMEGWKWDSTDKRFERTYDGLVHPLTKISFKYINEGETAWETLTVGTDCEVSYDPSTPKDVNENGYTATITITNSTYYSGEASISLYINPADLIINLNVPATIKEGTDVATWWNTDKVEYSGAQNNEKPKIEGTLTLSGEPNQAGTKLTATIENLKLVDNSPFLGKNYTPNWKNGSASVTVEADGTAEIPGDIEVIPDGNGDGDGGDGQDPTKYYNIYDVTEYDFIDVSFSRHVVREGGSVNVYLGIPEGLDPAAVTLMFKRSLYGTWDTLKADNEGNYKIDYIWSDIYVKAVVDESYIDPNPDENHIYIDLSETNDSIWLYTERKLVEEGKTAVIQAEVAKSCQNKEIRYMYKRTVLGEWKEMPKDYSINQYVVRDITTDIYVKAYFVFDKQDPTTAKNPHHVYADITATCEGLYLDATRRKVADEGDTKVFLYVKKGFETKDARYQFKRGLKGEWEDLVPGIEQNTFQVTDIEGDIYLKGIDAVYTGTEDIDGMVRVYTKDGSLFVYTAQPEEISVVSMTGVTVKRTRQTGLQSYPLNQGIYVVRVGEQVFKVRVK